LDEAPTLPAIFQVIRAVIDATRSKNGRFLLLGSVSPELLTSISESLAGRVGILELTPFIYSEVAGRRGMKLENLWLRGGYPDALLQALTMMSSTEAARSTTVHESFR